MKIIVCAKVVLDPEAPASLFKVDPEGKKVIPPKGTPPVLNPFDENALEAALKIKDSASVSITVISLGKNIPVPVVRKALASGADNLFLLEEDSFNNLDSYSTASILANVIHKIGEFDLIICGREAADTNSGQVGLGIAEILGIPSVSLVGKLEYKDSKLIAERRLSDGAETIIVPLPALITVSNEMGNLRTPPLRALIGAQKKPITFWNVKELVSIQPQANKIVLQKVFQPIHQTQCELINAATSEEMAIKLACRLREAKVI